MALMIVVTLKITIVILVAMSTETSSQYPLHSEQATLGFQHSLSYALLHSALVIAFCANYYEGEAKASMKDCVC